MKRIKWIGALAVAATLMARAELTYIKDARGVVITGFIGNAEHLIIPEMIDQEPVQVIGAGAFRGNSRLKSVQLPQSIVWFEEEALADCPNLKGVLNVSSNVVRIEAGAFRGGGIEGINVGTGNLWYSSVDGALVLHADSDSPTLLQYPAGRTNHYFRIPPANTIDYRAFDGSANLRAVTVPASVHGIRGLAFRGCTNLTTLFFEGTPPGNGCAGEMCSVDTNPVGDIAADSATVYYLGAPNQWPAFFSGRPTVAWQPALLSLVQPVINWDDEVAIEDPWYGRRLALTIMGPPGIRVVLERKFALEETWTSISRQALEEGVSVIEDPTGLSFNRIDQRFFRFRVE